MSSTTHRLVLVLVVIGLVTVLVLAGVGYLLVRASLRPLREVERTAATEVAARGSGSGSSPRSWPGTAAGSVDTAPGREATFRVRLPLAPTAAGADASPLSDTGTRG